MARPKSFISKSEAQEKPFVEIFKSFCGTSARVLIEEPEFQIATGGVSRVTKPGVWAEFSGSLYHCTDPTIAAALHEHKDYYGNGGGNKYISLNDLISNPNESMRALVCPHCRRADYTDKVKFLEHVAECSTKRTQREATTILRTDLRKVGGGGTSDEEIGAQPGK